MTAVTIPPEVLADVEARPAAYRPSVDDDQPVLILGCDLGEHRVNGTGQVGPTMHAWRSERDAPSRVGALTVGIGHPEADSCEATAWALVGSVDGGPRPEVGARVLVLACLPEVTAPEAVGQVGTVVVATYGPGLVGVEVDGVPCLASRWALLPNPAPDAPSAPPPATATPDPARGER